MAEPTAAPAAPETRRSRRGETQEEAAARKTAGRQRAEAERAAAVERRAAGRRKVEAEQQAAAERKAERRRKVEAEQQAAADRRSARRQRAGEEKAAERQRKDRKQFHADTAPAPTALPPTPIADAPVEGKGRHAVVDSLAVASLLGDAANLEAPLTETLPPVEPAPDEDLLAAAEQRRQEREQRAAERAARHAETRRERKRDREAAAAPRAAGEVTGTITVRPEGYGFLKRQEGPPGEDIFLPPDELVGVMDGDRLRVRIVRGKFGRDAGQLLEVLDRRRRHLLGTFYRRGRTTYIVPVDPTLPRFVSVRGPDSLRDGQVVKVAITQYPEPGVQQLLGDVEKVVGNPDDPLVEVLEVAYANGFAEEFPADVLAESERIPDHVTAEEKAGRRDLSGLRLITIDGEDARDFDDAVYVERRAGGGFRLVVAIADVAHYVQPGTRLNEEALHRATSVYFPNHVLPMLPERLSNGICSLNPDVDRLCMVADVSFDSSGRPVDADVYDGVMLSHARCTYSQVAEILEGKPMPELDHVRDDILLAGDLAKQLRKQRIARGALDFDLPEAKPILDEDMQVVEIARRPRNDAHRLVEEFMLAANEAVARYFGQRGLPTVYRVHGEPDPEKLENFVALAQAVGFQFDMADGLTPVRLGEWLRQIEGTPQQKALNTLLLRAMMQAVYTPENIGHFGLGAEHYLHFTSPIRRYPDLIVHRLLKEHWARGGKVPQGAALDEMEAELEELAAQSSLRERAAMEAEREIDAYFKCLFVQDKVGEIFDATIVSITDFGFFAEIDDFPVDGLVRAEELGTNWELDLRQHRLVFGSGLSFGVGEHVKVEISGVDILKRQIGLVLVTNQAGEEVLPIRPRNFGQPRGGGAPHRGGGRPAFSGRSGDRDGARSGRHRDGGRPGGERGAPREGKSAGGLTDAIDRVRSQHGGKPGPAPREPLPAERRGGRFAAGDRQAAWGARPQTARSGPGGKPDGDDAHGGRKGKKKGKKRSGRKHGRNRR